jgi:energy-coupling factor transporter ATP-binding protein EcfA2
MWTIDKFEINGGFLPGMSLNLPPGLICIIGPRGSGKSTLAETLRFAMKGTVGASKQRLDLLQANVGSSGLITLCANSDGVSYTIRRGYKQPAVLLSADGRTVPNVDLDRGTFLPLDAYSGLEIEAIADETLGDRRRALLDDLRGDQLSQIHLSLGEHKRRLEANGDQIRAVRRSIDDLSERIEEVGDVRGRLDALGPQVETTSSIEYTKASKQQQSNMREKKRLDETAASLNRLKEAANLLKVQFQDQRLGLIFEGETANVTTLQSEFASVQKLISNIATRMAPVIEQIDLSIESVKQLGTSLLNEHAQQAAEFAKVQQVHQVADDLYRVRLDLEQSVSRLLETEADRAVKRQELATLLKDRQTLKAVFLLEREQISTIRDSVAAELQQELGKKVRIRVIRNADDLDYRNLLTEGLKGARVRNHDEILTSLMQLRPEQLAQMVQSDDAEALDEACSFGTERARKIMDAFRENVDPLQMEIVQIEDQVKIELNVATNEQPIFKDAAELSRGQKCTALLPLLLARTQNPLIIDQPEDNLDNHFIYETVVNSIQRLKGKRQMIFITHNANIPVLAEADLVIVMNSDGKVGYIEKSGSIDECRDQIVDLLEGGNEAFELRRKRYAGA